MLQIYLAIKFHDDQRYRSVIEDVSATLAGCGFATRCVQRDLEHWGRVHYAPAALMRQTFTMIDHSALVVIVLLEKGVGLGIEAGYAYARGVPIVLIVPPDAEISPTLRGIASATVIDDAPERVAGFFQALANWLA